ncbi:hypothetical protein [Pelagicoccus sp. SDUM812003]|uniref:hypothetical protein n=1 Tax=Pelagicoccus sp. SDUM812003 TaxID=3041267 RepID=UPI00280E9E85|nr:hypothetical protein [Pelagicoccus sp. SDUM812003]MDQ8205736.1 hypothetical protein [Pelagicoccus sp. SDUM812003]
MEEENLKACKSFSQDVQELLMKVGVPEMEKAVCGENDEKVIKGPDGKEYLKGPMKKLQKEAMDALVSSLESKNPIMRNTISAHSSRIVEAQQNALYKPLQEKKAKFKNSIDHISRRTRHWWVSAMLFAGIGSAISLLLK